MTQPAKTVHYQLTWQPITLRLRNPFRLSYGVTDMRQVFSLRVSEPGSEQGLGRGRDPALLRCLRRVDDRILAGCGRASRPAPR